MWRETDLDEFAKSLHFIVIAGNNWYKAKIPGMSGQWPCSLLSFQVTNGMKQKYLRWWVQSLQFIVNQGNDYYEAKITGMNA